MTDITPEELEELKRLLADAEFETRNSRESIIPTFGSFEGAFAHAIRNAAGALIRSAEELGRVKARLETLFEAIKHGDDAHQAWLREAIAAHCAGLPVPAPTGGGSKERLAEAIRMTEDAENANANCDECGGEGVPELCGKCFPLFDDARIARQQRPLRLRQDRQMSRVEEFSLAEIEKLLNDKALLHQELAIRTAEVTALKAANEEMRGRLEKAERVVEALKMVRFNWAGHAEQCAYVMSRYKRKCDCDWPKLEKQCDDALSVYSKET
jgi:hypothetical protein